MNYRCGIIGFGLAAGVMLYSQPSLRVLSNGVRQLTDRVRPAVVQISAVGIGAAESSPGRLTSNRSTGSGVLVDPAGYIITNAHVVGTARRVQVILAPVPGETRSILKPVGRT